MSTTPNTPATEAAPVKAAAAPAPATATKASAPKAAPKPAARKTAAPKAPVAKAPVAAKAPAAKRAAAKTPAAKPAVAKTAVAKPVAAKPAKAEAKPKKPKLVRDSFTIPKDEYVAIDTLKERSVALGRPAKKSELLRAGLMALQAMSPNALRAALEAVPTIKTGRPKTDK